MMCELFCGKVNYDVYKKEKEHDGKYAEDISPYKVLSSRIAIKTNDWISIVTTSENHFGNMVWLDWGSFLCRGDYETMKSFLQWNRVDDKTMAKFERMRKDGDFGFVFIEDY